MSKDSKKKADIVYRNAPRKEKSYTIQDGNGLSMLVPSKGTKQWIFRYTWQKKPKKINIKGGYPQVSLDEARKQAALFREMLSRGLDPMTLRKEGYKQDAAEEALTKKEEDRKSRTLQAFSRMWFDDHYKEKVTEKTLFDNWSRMQRYVLPYVGHLPIDEIEPPMILDALKKMQASGAVDSALRVQCLCNQIFKFAKLMGYVTRNPAEDLRELLKKRNCKSFAAIIEPSEVGPLLLAIEGYQGSEIVRAALKLAIFTFVRPGNIRFAKWKQFDFDKAEWRIPGSEMKVKTEEDFVVPLASQAIQVLRDLHPITGRGEFLFPHVSSKTRPMSNNTMNAALRRLGYTNQIMTAHGVRAMARTLIRQELDFHSEVIEEQLAHAKAGPLGETYDRTTFMKRRREMMSAYADYLDKLKEGATRRPGKSQM